MSSYKNGGVLPSDIARSFMSGRSSTGSSTSRSPGSNSSGRSPGSLFRSSAFSGGGTGGGTGTGTGAGTGAGTGLTISPSHLAAQPQQRAAAAAPPAERQASSPPFGTGGGLEGLGSPSSVARAAIEGERGLVGLGALIEAAPVGLAALMPVDLLATTASASSSTAVPAGAARLPSRVEELLEDQEEDEEDELQEEDDEAEDDIIEVISPQGRRRKRARGRGRDGDEDGAQGGSGEDEEDEVEGQEHMVDDEDHDEGAQGQSQGGQRGDARGRLKAHRKDKLGSRPLSQDDVYGVTLSQPLPSQRSSQGGQSQGYGQGPGRPRKGASAAAADASRHGDLALLLRRKALVGRDSKGTGDTEDKWDIRTYTCSTLVSMCPHLLILPPFLCPPLCLPAVQRTTSCLRMVASLGAIIHMPSWRAQAETRSGCWPERITLLWMEGAANSSSSRSSSKSPC